MGRQNLELKAYCDDLIPVAQRLTAIGAVARDAGMEIDTYFVTKDMQFKYRVSNDRPDRLIAYRRLNRSGSLDSSFEVFVADSGVHGYTLEALTRGLGVAQVVEKHRSVFTLGSAEVHLDRMGPFNLIEIEVEQTAEEGAVNKQSGLWELAQQLGIHKHDVSRFSNQVLSAMSAAAQQARVQLGGGKIDGIVLLDGASGVGKSTLLNRLRKDAGVQEHAGFVRRCTTRTPRKEDPHLDEYMFVSREEFNAQAEQGQFLEYRHFDFDMSYGLAWESLLNELQRRPIAYGLVNLGNIRHIRALVPEARTVLITAPLDQIRRRLIARGTHDQAAIDERMDNARTSFEAADLYDVVIDNSDAQLDRSYERLRHAVLNWEGQDS